MWNDSGAFRNTSSILGFHVMIDHRPLTAPNAPQKSRNRIKSATLFLFPVTLAGLAASTCLAPAYAQSAVQNVAPATKRKPVVARPTSPPQAAPTGQPHVEEVTVQRGAMSNGITNTTPGGGLMPPQTAPKSRSGLTRDFIAKQSPTSNPVAMVASLPGVVYSSNDPLGTNDDQQGLSVRGMDQNEIGFLFEGIPAAAPVYLLPYTSDAADNENIQSVTLTQGSPDISSPLYNAVGGELVEKIRDPSKNFGGFANFSYGSFSLKREFIRVDTGEIGHTGIRSFVSFSDRTADEWRGVGNTRRWHVDAKFLKEWGQGNRTSLVISYTDPTQYYLRAPTLSQWKQYGVNYNYDDKYRAGDANYYKFEENTRKSLFLGAPSNFSLGKNLSLTTTPFFAYSYGYDNGGDTLDRTGSYFGTQPAGTLQAPGTGSTITAASVDQFTYYYSGLNTVLEWHTKHNTLDAGAFYSYYDQSESTPFVAAGPEGQISSMYGKWPILTQDDQTISQFNVHMIQQTNGLFLNDTLSLFKDRLKVTAGFKEMMITRKETNLVPGVNYQNGESEAEPLPQFAASYSLTPHDQIYINGTTSFRLPASISTYMDRFSLSTGQMTRQHVIGPKPEFAIGEELGYRHTGLVNLALAFFNYNFTNRQLNTTVYLNGLPTTQSIDGGGQTARGGQMEIGLRPWHNFSPYMSTQYLHATTDNNLRSGTDYLPTAGKTAVKSPKWTVAIGLNYDDGHVFGGFNMNYISSQYSTFMNDEKIPSFETFNLNFGYRFGEVWFLKHPQIQMNLLNIGNSGYLSGVSSISGTAKGTRGVFGSTIAGTAPSYYVGGGFAGIMSFSSGF